MSEAPASHLAALGLQRNPFPPTPDAQSYFYTPKLEREFSEALHCVLSHKGIILLAGEVGLGKSTFVRHMLDALADKGVVYALVLNTFLQGPALLQEICRDFGIAPVSGLAENLAQLNEFLLQKRRDGLTCLVVIDDAQNLNLESLELIRLLTNLETGQEKLLQIVLAGQPELIAALAKPEIRQLTSRIVAHVHLETLKRDELLRYFEFRVGQAGAAGRLQLDGKALTLLHRISGGNPRRVHLILDRCLYGLVARRSTAIDRDLIEAAAAEVDFNRCVQTSHVRQYWRRYAATAGGFTLLGALGVAFAMQLSGNGNRPVSARNLMAETPAAQSASMPGIPTTKTGAPLQAAQKETTATGKGAEKDVPSPSLSSCMQALLGYATAHNDSANGIKVFMLPEALAPRIKADKRTCLYREGSRQWVAWHASFSAAGLATRTASPDTETVQQRLAAFGLLDPRDADGWFGPRTRAALARFQTLSGYGKNGEPDDLSLFLLEKLKVTDLNPDQAGASRG